MDVNLCERFKALSSDVRLYTSSIKNADGQLAEPGDLLCKGGKFGECVKEWVGQINQDPNRKFNICSRHKTGTLEESTLENGQDHDDASVTTGTVTVTCRGNQKKMRSGKLQKGHPSSDYGDEHNDEENYEFDGIQSSTLLNMKQIQQLRRIGKDHTRIWFWAHYQSSSGVPVKLPALQSSLVKQKLVIRDS